jgi:glutamate-1-semialdehyde 2,1-aminomutase
VILEAEKNDLPQDGFLHKLKQLCHDHGALMIIDEIITGFRFHLGGAQYLHGVEPDLTTFGKAMGNGFAISALAGKREIMELGGLHHDRERVFLLSTTFGAEYHALAAAIETIRIYQEEDVIGQLYRQGERLEAGIQRSVAEHGLQDYFGVLGRPCCLVYFTRDQEGNPSQPFRTLFLQETIRRGLIMPSLIVSYSHTDAAIDRTVEAIHESLFTYKKALNEGVDKYLLGNPVQPVYRKYN